MDRAGGSRDRGPGASGHDARTGLGRLGWKVGIGARDDERREAAVEKLRADGIDAFAVPLDVTNDASAAAAADLLAEHGGLDVLVNNAGIFGDRAQTPSSTDPQTIRTVVETNVIGPVRVTNAMLPMLRQSKTARIVNMSSNMGSMTLRHEYPTDVVPIALAYAPSKAFLNAVTVQYAKELEGTGILVNASCPGYVATDFTNHLGVRTPKQGAAIAIKRATLPDDGPNGGFFDDAGAVPW